MTDFRLKQQIKQAFDEGKSYGLIARQLGVTRNSVASFCRRYGWSRNGKYAPMNLAEETGRAPGLSAAERREWGRAFARTLKKHKVTQKAFAEALGLSQSAVWIVVSGRNGLSMARLDKWEQVLTDLLVRRAAS